jgi:hypothetical protein
VAGAIAAAAAAAALLSSPTPRPTPHTRTMQALHRVASETPCTQAPATLSQWPLTERKEDIHEDGCATRRCSPMFTTVSPSKPVLQAMFKCRGGGGSGGGSGRGNSTMSRDDDISREYEEQGEDGEEDARSFGELLAWTPSVSTIHTVSAASSLRGSLSFRASGGRLAASGASSSQGVGGKVSVDSGASAGAGAVTAAAALAAAAAPAVATYTPTVFNPAGQLVVSRQLDRATHASPTPATASAPTPPPAFLPSPARASGSAPMPVPASVLVSAPAPLSPTSTAAALIEVKDAPRTPRVNPRPPAAAAAVRCLPTVYSLVYPQPTTATSTAAFGAGGSKETADADATAIALGTPASTPRWVKGGAPLDANALGLDVPPGWSATGAPFVALYTWKRVRPTFARPASASAPAPDRSFGRGVAAWDEPLAPSPVGTTGRVWENRKRVSLPPSSLAAYMVLYRVTVPPMAAPSPSSNTHAAVAAAEAAAEAVAAAVVCKKAKLRGGKARGDEFHQCLLLPPGSSSASGPRLFNGGGGGGDGFGIGPERSIPCRPGCSGATWRCVELVPPPGVGSGPGLGSAGKHPDGAWVELMLEFSPAAAVEEVVVIKADVRLAMLAAGGISAIPHIPTQLGLELGAISTSYAVGGRDDVSSTSAVARGEERLPSGRSPVARWPGLNGGPVRVAAATLAAAADDSLPEAYPRPSATGLATERSAELVTTPADSAAATPSPTQRKAGSVGGGAVFRTPKGVVRTTPEAARSDGPISGWGDGDSVGGQGGGGVFSEGHSPEGPLASGLSFTPPMGGGAPQPRRIPTPTKRRAPTLAKQQHQRQRQREHQRQQQQEQPREQQELEYHDAVWPLKAEQVAELLRRAQNTPPKTSSKEDKAPEAPEAPKAPEASLQGQDHAPDLCPCPADLLHASLGNPAAVAAAAGGHSWRGSPGGGTHRPPSSPTAAAVSIACRTNGGSSVPSPATGGSHVMAGSKSPAPTLNGAVTPAVASSPSSLGVMGADRLHTPPATCGGGASATPGAPLRHQHALARASPLSHGSEGARSWECGGTVQVHSSDHRQHHLDYTGGILGGVAGVAREFQVGASAGDGASAGAGVGGASRRNDGGPDVASHRHRHGGVLEPRVLF